jgi:hypothetical protein
MTMPSIATPDGRAAFAFLAVLGGCGVFTVFAAVGVYLVRASAWFELWLAAAHGQILVGMSALGFVLGRRAKIEAGRDKIMVSDQVEVAAQTVADAAQGQATAIKDATA